LPESKGSAAITSREFLRGKKCAPGRRAYRASRENQISRRSNRADKSIGGPVSQWSPGRIAVTGETAASAAGASIATTWLGPTVIVTVGATTAGTRDISGQSRLPGCEPLFASQLRQPLLELLWQQQGQEWFVDLGGISAAFSAGHFPTPQQQANGAAVHSASGIMAQITPTRSRPTNSDVRALCTGIAMRLKDQFALLARLRHLIQPNRSLWTAAPKVNTDDLLTASVEHRFGSVCATLPVRPEIVVWPVFPNRSTAMEITDSPAP